MEDDMRLNSQILGQGLQVSSILLAITAENMRVSRTCDHVNHVIVLRQNPWKRLNYVLDPFIGREQAEGE